MQAPMARTDHSHKTSRPRLLPYLPSPCQANAVRRGRHLMSAEPSIQLFSTQTVPRGMRFDYWLSILRQSLWPVTEWTVPRDFNVELREAPLGCLSSMTETISPSDAYRTPR